MSKIPQTPADVFSEFTDDLRGLYQDRLVSILLFGSGARGEYRPGVSDLNFLVVLEDNRPSELAKFHPISQKWQKRKVSTPFFLTEKEILSSLDTFPIEFLEMQSSHTLVEGKDVLADLTFSPTHLRHQCERELKGKIFHLRHAFLENRGDLKNLVLLIKTSLKDFAPLFRSLLVLAGLKASGPREALLDRLCQAFHLEPAVYQQLSKGEGEMKKFSPKEINALFDAYVKSLDKLVKSVENLPVKEEQE